MILCHKLTKHTDYLLAYFILIIIFQGRQSRNHFPNKTGELKSLAHMFLLKTGISSASLSDPGALNPNLVINLDALYWPHSVSVLSSYPLQKFIGSALQMFP